MDKKKINIAIKQLKIVHRDMNDCVNRFILKDAIDQLQEQVKNCSIPDVSQQRELFVKEQGEWLMANTNLSVEQIIDFEMDFINK